MEKIKEHEIEYPVEALSKGRSTGHYVNVGSEGRWCQKRKPGQYGDWDYSTVWITERECEENIVRARQEYENAYARLLNLERLRNAIDMEKARPGYLARSFGEFQLGDGFTDVEAKMRDEEYETVSSCD
jgi:hypothetical protein